MVELIMKSVLKDYECLIVLERRAAPRLEVIADYMYSSFIFKGLKLPTKVLYFLYRILFSL